MNKFLEEVYLFNKLGACPQDQTYKNLIGGLQLVQEEVKESEDALFEFLKNDEEWTPETRAELLDGAVDTFVTVTGLLYRAGFNRQQIELAMSLVSEANLNKYCKTEEDAVKSVEQYKDDNRYSNVHWEDIVIDNVVYYAIIGETEQGGRKILKGVGHVDPKGMLKEICR